ncbi:MAG: hypothetical protein EZS28_025207 [Streblomastix strix]|uniref:Uncharacterized protein n=1 Tax=Streblomastix strix TaxID=222440 RepID=A0A5J4V9R4_9EUKA|nr:MAG: hypothetical protein EZS28_025207 [Streblomastix strix]
MSIILNIAIYNHNPKNGGLLSCPNGTFASLQNIMLFGNIFIVRMLYGWPFWRGVVNVGVSILICVYLVCSVYILFVHVEFSFDFVMDDLWVDDYAFEGLMNNIAPTIIFIFVGAILAGRQRIIDASLQLIDAIKEKETPQTIQSTYQQLVNATLRPFTDEENDMLSREYRGSKNVTQEKILQSEEGQDENQQGMNENQKEIKKEGKVNDKQEAEEGIGANDYTLKFAINPNSDPKMHNYRTHSREHLIIRQRLTILGDQLHVETDGGASQMIARRNIIRLYDVHFSNADLAYATIIPESEKTQVGDVNDTIS